MSPFSSSSFYPRFSKMSAKKCIRFPYLNTLSLQLKLDWVGLWQLQFSANCKVDCWPEIGRSLAPVGTDHHLIDWFSKKLNYGLLPESRAAINEHKLWSASKWCQNKKGVKRFGLPNLRLTLCYCFSLHPPFNKIKRKSFNSFYFQIFYCLSIRSCLPLIIWLSMYCLDNVMFFYKFQLIRSLKILMLVNNSDFMPSLRGGSKTMSSFQ